MNTDVLGVWTILSTKPEDDPGFTAQFQAVTEGWIVNKWAKITLRQAITLLAADSPGVAKDLEQYLETLPTPHPEELNGLHSFEVWVGAIKAWKHPLPKPASDYFSATPQFVDLITHDGFTEFADRFVKKDARIALEIAIARFSSTGGLQQQAATNFRDDPRMLGIAWFEYFNAFLCIPSDTQLINQLVMISRRYATHGPKYSYDNGVVLGRIVPYHSFRHQIVGKSGEGTRNFDKWIEFNSSKPSNPDWPKAWAKRLVSDKPMWAILGDPPGATCPFQCHFKGQSSDFGHITCRLGIYQGGKKSRKWMSLRYKLPSDVSPHFPTSADAFAGGFEGNFQFRPAQKRASYNLTQPLFDCSGAKGIPECIHVPIAVSQIIGPIVVEKKDE